MCMRYLVGFPDPLANFLSQSGNPTMRLIDTLFIKSMHFIHLIQWHILVALLLYHFHVICTNSSLFMLCHLSSIAEAILMTPSYRVPHYQHMMRKLISECAYFKLLKDHISFYSTRLRCKVAVGQSQGKMSSSQESDISLPSPDRVANLWRYDQTPAKLKAVSEEECEGVFNSVGGPIREGNFDHHPSRVTVPRRYEIGSLHCAEANVAGDVNLEEQDLSMGSESNICSGEREFSNILDYYASLDISSRREREEHENLSRSGSLEEASYISAGEMSSGQVEQEKHGDLFSSRRSQNGPWQEKHSEDNSAGDPLAQFLGSHEGMPQRQSEQEAVLGVCLRDAEHEEQLCALSQGEGNSVTDQEPEERIKSGVREAQVEGGLESDLATEGLIKSQEVALEMVNSDGGVGHSRTRTSPGGQLLVQCSQELNRIWETTPPRELETFEAGGNGQLLETPKTDEKRGGVKRTVSEANFDIDLDNMESDYDLESGKTPGEQHFGGTPSSHVGAPGNLDDTVPFDETISDPQMHSRVLNNISPSSSLCGAPEVTGGNTSADNQGRCRMGGAASGTKSTSTAWSLPMRGLLSGREAGDHYTASTPLNRNYTSSTPQSKYHTSSTPSRGKGCNFSTSTPIRHGSCTPQAPQWSPHPSQALCGAGGDSFHARSTAVVARQNPSPSILAGNVAQMQGSVQEGFVASSRPQYDATPNRRHSVQVRDAKLQAK